MSFGPPGMKAVEEKKKMNEKNDETQMVLENKISWLEMIPNDVILSKVCSYLWMNDMFNFSKCAQRYAIICNSPPAMNNFQLSIQGKDICSEENYFHKHQTDHHHHRLLGVKFLMVDFCFIHDNYVPYYLTKFFRKLKHVQHMEYSRNSMKNYIEHFAQPRFQELKSISFVYTDVNTEDLIWLLDNDQSSVESDDKISINEEKNIFNCDIIYNLETIAFNGCLFSDDSFPYLYELLLPSKINKLSVLKLQDCKIIADEKRHVLEDENRIRRSLCNLRAFVAHVYGSNFLDFLSRKILSVLQFQLECIHIYYDPINMPTINNFIFPFLMQNSEYYASKKQKEILHLKELCISFPSPTEAKDLLFKKICANLLEDIFLTYVPNQNTGGLKKLCLTFPSITVANAFVNNPLKTMLRKSTSLKFLQLKIEHLHRKDKKDFHNFFTYLCSAFSGITSETSETAFVFKVQFGGILKCGRLFDNIFSTKLPQLVNSYLAALPNGFLQLNCIAYEMQITDCTARKIIENKRVIFSKNNCFSIMNINAYESCVVYDTNWTCECTECNINTPWFTEASCKIYIGSSI